jgi:hypothetical protein
MTYAFECITASRCNASDPYRDNYKIEVHGLHISILKEITSRNLKLKECKH